MFCNRLKSVIRMTPRSEFVICKQYTQQSNVFLTVFLLLEEGMIFVDGVLQNDVEIQGPLRNPVMLTKFFNGEEVIDNRYQGDILECFVSNPDTLEWQLSMPAH